MKDCLTSLIIKPLFNIELNRGLKNWCFLCLLLLDKFKFDGWSFTVNALHNGIAQDSKSLFCVIGDAILSYNIDLDLTGIVESVFDALCNVARKEYHLVIRDLFGLDHNANLTTGLNGI